MQEIMKTKFHNLLYFYDARIVGVRRTEQSVGIIVGGF